MLSARFFWVFETLKNIVFEKWFPKIFLYTYMAWKIIWDDASILAEKRLLCAFSAKIDTSAHFLY